MDLELKGNINVLKGKLKEKYGELTDDDFVIAEGEEDQFLGLLQKKLGKTEDEVVSELNKLISAN
ncbi:MAG: hypothetical protein Tsb0034_19960 [Ekhidna sp.]